MKSCRCHRRLFPLALAALLALGGGGLNAAPRSYVGPGSFWVVVANWTGGILPGAADDALLGGFDTEIRASFTLLGFFGTGSLQVAGASTWIAGARAGTGSTTWPTPTANQGRIRTGSTATLNNNESWLVANAIGGPADALSGGWDLSALTPGNAFTLAGLGNFATANAGSFDRVLVFNGLSVNGSGPDLALPRLSLQLHGSVAAVPEPETWGMMLGGLPALGLLSRRRLQARAD